MSSAGGMIITGGAVRSYGIQVAKLAGRTGQCIRAGDRACNPAFDADISKNAKEDCGTDASLKREKQKPAGRTGYGPDVLI